MNSVQMKVAEQISSIAPKVEDAVVAVLTDRELERRSNALVQALDKLDTMEKAFKKLGPDQTTFDETGAKTTESFSKQRIEARNKETRNIDKLTKAINKSLESGDFNDLYNLSKQGGNNQKSSGNSGDEETASDAPQQGG